MPQGHVLVVEDDDAIRRLLMEYLRERACTHVDGARDGADALHQISTNDYEVVILDLMMPYMSGIDFLASLDALVSDPSVGLLVHPPAVVVVTGAPADEVRSEDLRQRYPSFVRDVLRKPVDFDRLSRTIAALLV